MRVRDAGRCPGRARGDRGAGQSPGAAARQADDFRAVGIGGLAGLGQGASAPGGVKALERGEQVLELVLRRRCLNGPDTAPRRGPGGNFPQAGQEGGEEEAEEHHDRRYI